MKIKDEKKLKEIQEAFQAKFPHLKLEFYARRHQAGEGSPVNEVIDPEKTIGEVRKIHKEGELKIEKTMPVKTLEQTFADQYGLHVQVFRKSGHIWLQTSATDNWTLEEQNRKGGHSELLVDG